MSRYLEVLYRALLQDLVEIVMQDVEQQSDRLVETIHRAKLLLAEEQVDARDGDS
jgi:hypothetical protein